MVKKINLFLYGLLLSAFIGAVASFFLFIETILTDFLWQSSRALPNLLVILAGAYLLFLMQRKRPYLPKTAHDSLNELKKRKERSIAMSFSTWASRSSFYVPGLVSVRKQPF